MAGHQDAVRLAPELDALSTVRTSRVVAGDETGILKVISQPVKEYTWSGKLRKFRKIYFIKRKSIG